MHQQHALGALPRAPWLCHLRQPGKEKENEFYEKQGEDALCGMLQCQFSSPAEIELEEESERMQ